MVHIKPVKAFFQLRGLIGELIDMLWTASMVDILLASSFILGARRE
jgi:hypothetical protein